VVKKGSDLVIFATGIMVQESLTAMEMLDKDGINVTLVNISTLKPIDRDIVIEMASSHKAVITAEDHNYIGGLGDAVGEVLLDVQISKPFKRIAVKDHFAETGTGPELFEKYGLSANHIAKAVKDSLK
jgi:transketolase